MPFLIRATCTCRPTIPAVSGNAFACVACGARIVVESASANVTHYSTESADLYPPHSKGKRRNARDKIRSVEGHEQSGVGKNTQWRVARELYDAHHNPRPEVRAERPMTADDIAERALEGAGLRLTRRAS
jgi:hypothetical protein